MSMLTNCMKHGIYIKDYCPECNIERRKSLYENETAHERLMPLLSKSDVEFVEHVTEWRNPTEQTAWEVIAKLEVDNKELREKLDITTRDLMRLLRVADNKIIEQDATIDRLTKEKNNNIELRDQGWRVVSDVTANHKDFEKEIAAMKNRIKELEDTVLSMEAIVESKNKEIARFCASIKVNY